MVITMMASDESAGLWYSDTREAREDAWKEGIHDAFLESKSESVLLFLQGTGPYMYRTVTGGCGQRRDHDRSLESREARWMGW